MPILDEINRKHFGKRHFLQKALFQEVPQETAEYNQFELYLGIAKNIYWDGYESWYIEKDEDEILLDVSRSIRALVTGPSGSGKTFLIRAMGSRLRRAGFHIGYMTDIKDEMVTCTKPISGSLAEKLRRGELPQGLPTKVFIPSFLTQHHIERAGAIPKGEQEFLIPVSDMTEADISTLLGAEKDTTGGIIEICRILHEEIRAGKILSIEDMYLKLKKMKEGHAMQKAALLMKLRNLVASKVLTDKIEGLVYPVREMANSIIVQNLKYQEELDPTSGYTQLYVAFLIRAVRRYRTKGLLPNPIFMFIDEAHKYCLDEKTELLTEHGWKKIDEVVVGEKAVSFNPNTNQCSLEVVDRIIRYGYKGPMIHLLNQDGLDCLCTPEHRVVCKIRTSGKASLKNKNGGRLQWFSDWRFIPAFSLPTGVCIPTPRPLKKRGFCHINDDLLRILGWIITDGNFDKEPYKYVRLTQATFKKSKPALFKKMISAIKRRFPKTSLYIRKRTNKLPSGKIHSGKYVEFYFRKDGSDEIKSWLGDINLHRIPRKILETASLRQLKILFYSLIEGNGSKYQNSNYEAYYFACGNREGLPDDFQELCTRLGLSTTVKKLPKGPYSKHIQYVVRVSMKRKHHTVRKPYTKYFSGKVWDITIKNGAFVARRNGKVFITGNCPKKRDPVSKQEIITGINVDRYLGMSYILATQYPTQLPKEVVRQCNYIFIPKDIDLDVFLDLLKLFGLWRWGDIHTNKWEKLLKIMKQHDFLLIDKKEKQINLFSPAAPLCAHQPETRKWQTPLKEG